MLRRFSLLCLLCCLSSPLSAICGKVDGGPAMMRLTNIYLGTKTNKYWLYGVSLAGTIIVKDGWTLKPRLIYGGGDGDLWNVGLGVGYFLPVHKRINITPVVGASYGHLKIDVDLPLMPAGIEQTMDSVSPFVGVDVGVTILECLTAGFGIQYAWSRSQTTSSHDLLGGKFFDARSESRGFNFFGQLDYWFNSCWSANLAFASNDSHSKEKHGIKVMGWRLGVGYFF